MEPSKIVMNKEYKKLTQKQALQIIAEQKDTNIKRIETWQSHDGTFNLSIETITQSSEEEE